jgi:hypothetical protein
MRGRQERHAQTSTSISSHHCAAQRPREAPRAPGSSQRSGAGAAVSAEHDGSEKSNCMRSGASAVHSETHGLLRL